MKRFFTKQNIYIALFVILYSTVALVSLIHSFSFFGLANTPVMAIMLGTAFEIGQAAVLFSILTSSRDRSRIMPWALMILLTLVQIIGNIFSSYKYLMLNNVADLQYFKEPIFIWTTLPDNITTVIVTYVVGAILPIVALCMTSMIANYLEDNRLLKQEIEQVSNNDVIIDNTPEQIEQPQIINEQPQIINEEIVDDVIDNEQNNNNNDKQSHFVNI